MELTHRFTVPTDLDETWAHFQDVAGLAGCFPGAQVSSVEGDAFTGSCKVKLGPIALVYNGTGTFTERDEAAHRLVVQAKGKDKRGNGTAAATATLTMASASSGGTDVGVVSDLAITGKPAQFGRGLIQDVSDKLLGQFVSCLEQQLSTSAEPEPAAAQPESAAAQPESAAEPEPAAAQPEPAAAAPAPAAPALAAPALAAPAPAAPAPPVRVVPPPRPVPQQAEALDLGATVLPILLKSYWKQALAGAGVVGVLIWVMRR